MSLVILIVDLTVLISIGQYPFLSCFSAICLLSSSRGQNFEIILRRVGGIIYHSELPSNKMIYKGKVGKAAVHGGVVVYFKVIFDSL